MIYRVFVCNDDIRKATATDEGLRADARYAIRNRDARKVLATIEGASVNARHASVHGNNAVFTACYQVFACCINQAISGAVIFRISDFNRDARKAIATGEGMSADARYAVRNRDARKAIATGEGRFTDARYAVRNRDARKAIATGEGIITDGR